MRPIARLAILAATAFHLLSAQDWPQWGQNPQHTGRVNVAAQKPDAILGEYAYDHLADAMRADFGGNLLVHYMAPIVVGGDVYTLSRGDSRWVSCQPFLPGRLCGSQLWNQMEWGVTRLAKDPSTGKLEKRWTAMSDWKPAPDNGSGWEPVFHPAVHGDFLYTPGAGGMLMKFHRDSGELLDCHTPFTEKNPNRVTVSPIVIAANGAAYYAVIQFAPSQPWTSETQGSWLVKVDLETGEASKPPSRTSSPMLRSPAS